MTAETYEPDARQPMQPDDHAALRRIATCLARKRYRWYDDDGQLCRDAKVSAAKLSRLDHRLGMFVWGVPYRTLSGRARRLIG